MSQFEPSVVCFYAFTYARFGSSVIGSCTVHISVCSFYTCVGELHMYTVSTFVVQLKLTKMFCGYF